MRARRVLILGGCGRVGGALGRVLHSRGAAVLLTARDDAELKSFLAQSGLPSDSCALADFGHESAAEAFVRGVAADFAPDQVVLSFGQSLTDQPVMRASLEEVDRLWRDQIRSQFLALRLLLPHSPASSTFLMINGSTALTPQPGRGLANVAAAATLMLQRVVAAEASDTQARVISLLLQGAVDVPHLAPELTITDEALADAVEEILGHPGRADVYGLRPGQAPRALNISAEESPDLEELS